MTALLASPSFWTEPRDPWAWQRALRRVQELGQVPRPWPAWRGPLRTVLSRRAVPGLYGLQASPRPPRWLGSGLLAPQERGWKLHPDAQGLVEARRGEFEQALAVWLVRHSPWVRLALQRLASGAWALPRGAGRLATARTLRVGRDLDVGEARVRMTLGSDVSGVGCPLRVDVPARALAPLHAPLYLLHALGWLDAQGRPRLPDALSLQLVPDSPSTLLRRISAEEADARGYVVLSRVARRLWSALHPGAAHAGVEAWSDVVLGRAIARGTIEVHDWTPGQPRHGRGLLGDRAHKLVRWTVHDDFDASGGPS